MFTVPSLTNSNKPKENTMRATSKLLALALTAALQPAVAGVVALDFENSGVFDKLGNQYSSSGVVFSGDAWSVASAFCAAVLPLSCR